MVSQVTKHIEVQSDVSSQARDERNNLFDLLKFILVLFVVITHEWWPENIKALFIFPFVIDMAVPLFLLISAYLRTAKFQFRGLRESYTYKGILKSVMGILVPYVFVIVIECVFSLYMHGRWGSALLFDPNSPRSLLWWVLSGTSGPGSYYVPILFQLILYFPLIYLLFRRNKNIGLICAFLINALYEFLVFTFKLSPELYRLLIFRYTFILGLGIYLFYVSKDKRRGDVLAPVFFVVGFTYIVTNSFIHKVPLFQAWKSTSMLVGPYAFAILYFLLRNYSSIKPSILSSLGHASYHIYLVQMVYYTFVRPVTGYFLPSMQPPLLNFMNMLIAVVFCLGIGYLFYRVESVVRKHLMRGLLRVIGKRKTSSQF